MIYRLSLIVLLGDVIIGVVNPLYYVFTLTKRLKVPCVITISMGLVNVVSEFLLIKYTNTDAYAVVITTMFLNLLHFVDTPLYSAHCLGIRWTTFYPVILQHLINCLLVYGAMHVAVRWLPAANTWLLLLGKLVVLGTLGLMVSCAVMAVGKMANRIVTSARQS